MPIDISPTEITEKNVPQVLGAIVVELKNLNLKLDDHMEEFAKTINGRIDVLTERVDKIEIERAIHPNCITHQETLKRLDGIETTLKLHDTLFWTPLLVTRQDILPFLWRYKFVIGGITAILTAWLAITDWIVRSVQWELVPPIHLP